MNKRYALCDVSLAAEAALCLVFVRMAVTMVPFRYISRYLGPLHAPSRQLCAESDAEYLAEQVATAVRRACNTLPFPMLCLPRALAAWIMLERRKVSVQLHFGIFDTGVKSRPAHVWLDCGAVRVSGYPEALQCNELGYYSGGVRSRYSQRGRIRSILIRNALI